MKHSLDTYVVMFAALGAAHQPCGQSHWSYVFGIPIPRRAVLSVTVVCNVAVTKGYKDLRTVDGTECTTFKEAAIQVGSLRGGACTASISSWAAHI